MRLLHVTRDELREFHAAERPPYAILSHTWGRAEDEVTLQELRHYHRTHDHAVSSKPGFVKIRRLCAEAHRRGLAWVWIDTALIDQTSSAELSESINAMFRWYEQAAICYAYLCDVTGEIPHMNSPQFRASRWFTRGWTLQELLAPPEVAFYDQNWTFLGTRTEHADTIRRITGIPPRAYERSVRGDRSRWSSFSVAQQMAWAAPRVTTRPEDAAYCLLGLFGVTMPLLYGEGPKAFQRLQAAIIAQTDDPSIFAWGFSKAIECVPSDQMPFLAPSPTDFEGCQWIRRCAAWEARPSESEMRKFGVRMELPVTKRRVRDGAPHLVVLLDCCFADDQAHVIALRVIDVGAKTGDSALWMGRAACAPVRIPVRGTEYVAFRVCYLLQTLDPPAHGSQFAEDIPDGSVLVECSRRIVCESVGRCATVPVTKLHHASRRARVVVDPTTGRQRAVFHCQADGAHHFFLKVELDTMPVWRAMLRNSGLFSSRVVVRSGLWLPSGDHASEFDLRAATWQDEISIGGEALRTYVVPSSDGCAGTILSVQWRAPGDLVASTPVSLSNWKANSILALGGGLIFLDAALRTTAYLETADYLAAMVSICATVLLLHVIFVRAHASLRRYSTHVLATMLNDRIVLPASLVLCIWQIGRTVGTYGAREPRTQTTSDWPFAVLASTVGLAGFILLVLRLP